MRINFLRFSQYTEVFQNIYGALWAGKPIINNIRELSDYPARSEASDALSKDLKIRGFKFVGSTICYAHMQATGMVNDHSFDCFRKREITEQYGKGNGE